MRDAPKYIVWPPVALGVPLLLGLYAREWRPLPTGLSPELRMGAALVAGALFFVINGTGYVAMVRARTGILPGEAARTLLTRGPFRYSRNPLYVGLILVYVGIALLYDSGWALLLLPAAALLLHYGAVLPEERYLEAKFGDEYRAYKTRVRRWV
jgi:protein-S-isoprenylcysteine O-methyltransferase Ste14